MSLTAAQNTIIEACQDLHDRRSELGYEESYGLFGPSPSGVVMFSDRYVDIIIYRNGEYHIAQSSFQSSGAAFAEAIDSALNAVTL